MRLPSALAALLVALVVAGCASAVTESSGSVNPSLSRPPADPSGEPSPTPTAEPTAPGSPAPSQDAVDPPPSGDADIETAFLPFGQWARVTGDGLRVRYSPGIDSDFETTVSAGESLFLMGSGAVNVDGFYWYSVAHGAVVGADDGVEVEGFGWIAGSTSEGPSEEFIEFTSHSCPELPIDAETMAGLSGWALESCDTGSLTGLTGMLDNPIHGPVTPFSNEPSWLWFSPWYLTDPEEADDSFLQAGWAFAIHFPPDVDTSALRRGDLVTISGHVNDPAADDCRVLARDDGPEVTGGMQQAFELECRVKFVVDAFEVTGHVELPEP